MDPRSFYVDFGSEPRRDSPRAGVGRKKPYHCVLFVSLPRPVEDLESDAARR